jgi:hypothetical protein
MLAKRRKHKVIGRTDKLTNSTSLKKDTKYQGDPKGKNLDVDKAFIFRRKKVDNQKEKAADKLKERVVVTG